jgi:hypothetical protein
MNNEHERQDRHSSEPQEPSPLPTDLAEFLRDIEVACLMQETDQGTIFVIKLPARDIDSARGTVPIHLRHELYALPTAPVIRTILVIYDQPEAPFALETFTNIEDEQQRSSFAGLAQQDKLILLFYDEQLVHRLTKVVPQDDPGQSTIVLTTAERILTDIPREQFDFDRAKQAVMETTSL